MSDTRVYNSLCQLFRFMFWCLIAAFSLIGALLVCVAVSLTAIACRDYPWWMLPLLFGGVGLLQWGHSPWWMGLLFFAGVALAYSMWHRAQTI